MLEVHSQAGFAEKTTFNIGEFGPWGVDGIIDRRIDPDNVSDRGYLLVFVRRIYPVEFRPEPPMTGIRGMFLCLIPKGEKLRARSRSFVYDGITSHQCEVVRSFDEKVVAVLTTCPAMTSPGMRF